MNMTHADLQNLSDQVRNGIAAQEELKAYVESFFPAIIAANDKYQEMLSNDFPEHWPDTVHSNDHIANLFDLFEDFYLTNTHLVIQTYEVFRSEYDSKEESFPRAIFDETDKVKRAALIDAHFAQLAAQKRAEFEAKRTIIEEVIS